MAHIRLGDYPLGIRKCGLSILAFTRMANLLNMRYNHLMEVFKCWVPSGSSLCLYEGIIHDGDLWIVPSWLEAPSEGWKKPAYMIRISGLEFQDRSFVPGVQYALKTPIPKDVLDGKQSDEFEIRMAPDIRIPLPSKDIY